MKKLFLLTTCIALLCSCAKDEAPIPEKVMKTKAAARENVTLTLQFRFVNNPWEQITNVTPYGFQAACSEMGRYNIDAIYFTIRDVYCNYGSGLTFASDIGPEAIENGYSGQIPLAYTYDTYVDANSLRVVSSSSEYNFTFNVIGLPVRPYNPGDGGGGGEIIPPVIDSPFRAAYPPIM